MSSRKTADVGPRVEPEPAATVQAILEDTPEAAQANVERAEAILAELGEDDVPETFEIWWAEERQVFEGGSLDRGFTELLAAVVAHERGAAIRIAWHTTSAAIEEVDPERYSVAVDFEARKDELREHGYDDADIVELTTTAGTAGRVQPQGTLTPRLVRPATPGAGRR